MEPNIELNNKKFPIVYIAIGIAVVLAGLGIWYWQIQKSKTSIPSSVVIPAAQPMAKEDSISVVNQELNNIDIGGLDKEFQAIDTDLNSL